MNNLKSIIIKSSALVMLIALVSLNVNIDSFPDVDWSQISVSVETQSAHAQCPTCPTEDELKETTYTCNNGALTIRCVRGGSYCNISGQTTCPIFEKN